MGSASMFCGHEFYQFTVENTLSLSEKRSGTKVRRADTRLTKYQRFSMVFIW